MLEPSRHRRNIVHIVTRYASGGSERRIADVVSALPESNHIVVAGDMLDQERFDIELSGCQLELCNSLVRDIDLKKDMAAIREVAGIIKKYDPAVVHTHQSKASVVARLVRLLYRPDILLIHSASMASWGKGYKIHSSALQWTIEVLTSPLVDRFAVVGKDLARRLKLTGVSARKIRVIRTHIDLLRFFEVRNFRKNRISNKSQCTEKLRVVYVGSLEARKGVMELGSMVEMFEMISGRSVCLTIAGVGELIEEIKVLSVCGKSKIEYINYCNNVPGILKNTDLLVLLSKAEGLPQVLIQASAAGVPFAAYHVDGVKELLEMGSVGVVVPQGELQELVEASLKMLQESEKLCDLEVDLFSQWSLQAIGKQYRSLYRKAGILGQ